MLRSRGITVYQQIPIRLKIYTRKLEIYVPVDFIAQTFRAIMTSPRDALNLEQFIPDGCHLVASLIFNGFKDSAAIILLLWILVIFVYLLN
jgi:hypothetical protein